MSLACIPQFIASRDIKRFCSREEKIQGDLETARLSRLQENIFPESIIKSQVLLKFIFDLQGRQLLEGKVQASVQLSCQRCLHAMPCELKGSFTLLIAHDEMHLERMQSQDPMLDLAEVVVLTEDGLALWQLIEDEMLLNLPLAPSHDDINCSTLFASLKAQMKNELQQDGDNQSPFAGLSELLKNRKLE
jgi:uncharacterized protein